MAVKIIIKSKGLFKKELAFKDIIEPGMRYGVMDEAYRLDENKVGDYTVIFEAKRICRGFEISFSKGQTRLSLPLPSSKHEIEYFYNFVQKICRKMKTDEFIREEELVRLEDIQKFISLDVDASLRALEIMTTDVMEDKYDSMYIFGATNPIAIGKDEVKLFDNNLDKLADYLHEIQSLDVYYAKPNVYKNGQGDLFAVYVLTENVPSVIPYKPNLFMANKDMKVDDWNVALIYDEKMAGTISYDDFLSSITKREKYDAEHFIVSLSKDEMKKLLAEYRKDI